MGIYLIQGKIGYLNIIREDKKPIFPMYYRIWKKP